MWCILHSIDGMVKSVRDSLSSFSSQSASEDARRRASQVPDVIPVITFSTPAGTVFYYIHHQIGEILTPVIHYETEFIRAVHPKSSITSYTRCSVHPTIPSEWPTTRDRPARSRTKTSARRRSMFSPRISPLRAHNGREANSCPTARRRTPT